jgi:alkylation response protein AidB-like acyl-CoA dehydrogenase
MSVNNSLVCYGINEWGTEEQKQKYLIPLASGKMLGAFALSEPEAGSDASNQKTTAVRDGDYYILNGTKNFITNGASADIVLVMAATDKSKGPHGISTFIVEKGFPGFSVAKKEKKLGIRSSDTVSLAFQDCRVPKENRIGDEGFGFKFAMKTLDGGRIGIAAQALGIAMASLDASVRYSKQRKAFDHYIAEFQARRHGYENRRGATVDVKGSGYERRGQTFCLDGRNGKTVCFKSGGRGGVGSNSNPWRIRLY